MAIHRSDSVWEAVSDCGSGVFRTDFSFPFGVDGKKTIVVQTAIDVFCQKTPIDVVDSIFSTIFRCPQHTFLIATKHPEVLLHYRQSSSSICHNGGILCDRGCDRLSDNIWYGIIAETQEELEQRLPYLLQVPAKKRFVCIQPMRGPIDLTMIRHGSDQDLPVIGTQWGPDLVVCGGLDDPVHPHWVNALREQCCSFGVPFVLNGMGRWIECSDSFVKYAATEDQLGRIGLIESDGRWWPMCKLKHGVDTHCTEVDCWMIRDYNTEKLHDVPFVGLAGASKSYAGKLISREEGQRIAKVAMERVKRERAELVAREAGENNCCECEELRDTVQELAESLRELRDEQNGPPLTTREQQWWNAVGRADNILRKVEGAE